MGCEPGKSFEKWSAAVAAPLAPELVETSPVKEEIHVGDGLLEHGGLDEFPVPISTPGFDNGPYFTACHWITKDPDTGIRNVGNYRGQIKVPHQDRRLPDQRPAGPRHPLEQGQRTGAAAARGRGHRRGAVPLLRGGAEDRLRGGRTGRRRRHPGPPHAAGEMRDRGPGGAGQRGDRHRGLHPHRRAGARRPLRRVPRLHGPAQPESGVRGDLHHAPQEPALRGRAEPGDAQREQQDQAPGLGVAGAGPPAQPLQPQERGPGGHARAAGEPAPVHGGADAQDPQAGPVAGP